jgi:hypothetical protein
MSKSYPDCDEKGRKFAMAAKKQEKPNKPNSKENNIEA